ncbi:MAG: ATP-binding protein [Acidimicrobiales bacterium]
MNDSIEAYATGPGDPRFHSLVTGAPAIGKTAALRAIAKEASSRLGWAVCTHHCQPKQRALGGLLDEVSAGACRAWPHHVARFAHDVLSLARSSHHCSLEPVPPCVPQQSEVSWSALQRFLKLAGMFARTVSLGFVLVFDDADRLARGELEALGYLAKSLWREELPVAFVFGGSPSLQGAFASAGNFSNSVWPVSLPRFGEEEAREALVVPAAERGVSFEEAALGLLCAAAGGSPLEVQRLGFAAWSAARGADVISFGAAEEAVLVH